MSIQTRCKCILIPTFPPHFEYVRKLLSSIDTFNLDKEKTNVYLIFDNKQRVDDFGIILYKTIHVILLSIEEITFKLFDFVIDANQLLNSIQKFAYQSFKKILGVRYVTQLFDYLHVYVMDSEGMFIRPFSINGLIDNYLHTKHIFYNPNKRIDNIHCLHAKNFLKTHVQVPGWLLENYMWIYEKNIINDLFAKFINIKCMNDIIQNFKVDLMIEFVYYHFIYINNDKYNYTFIDVHTTLSNYLSEKETKTLTSVYVLEDMRKVLSINLIEPFSKIFKDFNIVNYKICGRNNKKYHNAKENILFVKNTPSIVVINSGDFPINFTIDI